MSVAVRSLLVAALATLVAVVVGIVTSAPPTVPAPPVAATGVALDELDTTTLAVRRASFCGAVPPAAVNDALGAEPVTATSYGNGESARLTREVEDVAHEYTCRWVAGRTRAEAWVFAPPVTPGEALELRTGAERAEGCERVADAPAYGQPSTALACTSGRTVSLTFRGLFGDAWLSCSLSLPRSEIEETVSARSAPSDDPADDPADERSRAATGLLERTSTWCASVATAAVLGDAPAAAE